MSSKMFEKKKKKKKKKNNNNNNNNNNITRMRKRRSVVKCSAGTSASSSSQLFDGTSLFTIYSGAFSGFSLSILFLCPILSLCALALFVPHSFLQRKKWNGYRCVVFVYHHTSYVIPVTHVTFVFITSPFKNDTIELNGENVIFPSFLESALHVCEVSRSHPDYISAHFHEKVGTDQFKQLDKNLPPHQYMNYTLFDSPPEEVFSRFEDLFDSSDIAHPLPQKYAMLSTSEIDVYPKSDAAVEGTFAKRAKDSVDKETKLTKIGLNDRNVAIVMALKCDNALDAENWMETFGIGNLKKKLKENFQIAVLHEVKLALGPMVENDEASQAEGDATPFTHVAYASLGEVEDSIANDAVSLINQALVAEGIADGSVVHAFKCAFNIAKKGTPCGALPAAREIQKRKEENEQARKNNKF